MKEFNDMVGKAPESEKKAAKPKPVKTPAAKPTALATSSEEIEKIARSGKLTKLTVAALSAFVVKKKLINSIFILFDYRKPI